MIVYTAITGNKDTRNDTVRVFSEFVKFKSLVYNAKVYKILPHKFLDTDISIWIDGNITLLIPPEQAVQEWLGDYDMAMFRHPKSRNLEQELKWIRYKFGRNAWQTKEAEEQVQYYEGKEIDEIVNGGIIIRRHIERVNRLNEAWWAEICVRGERDQLSFPIVKKEFPEVKLRLIEGDIKNHRYIKYDKHNYDIQR